MISYNKYWFDEIYEKYICDPIKSLGKFLWEKGDIQIIDKNIEFLDHDIIISIDIDESDLSYYNNFYFKGLKALLRTLFNLIINY